MRIHARNHFNLISDDYIPEDFECKTFVDVIIRRQVPGERDHIEAAGNVTPGKIILVQ